MIPVEEMRNAAQWLRERANAATSGPWHCGAAVQGLKDVYGPEGQRVAGGDWPIVSVADAEWMALMSPAVAEPLAAWLISAAKAAETLTTAWSSHPIETIEPNALAFARAVNVALEAL